MKSVSTFDNCILLNAILKNQSLFDDSNAGYLLMLQSLDLQIVTEYYFRSERTINKMRELGADNQNSWTEICDLYVNDIVDQIKNQNYNELVPKIRNMIEKLEVKYGINQNG
jgi:hypothetical protein